MVAIALLLFLTGVCVEAWTGKSTVTVDPDLELAFREEDLLYVVKEPVLSRTKRDTEDTFEGCGDGDEVLQPGTPDLGNVDPITVSTDFRITSLTASEFNETHRENFSLVLSESFREVPGFQGVNITDVREGSAIVSILLLLIAEIVNHSGWGYTQTKVLSACIDVAVKHEYDIDRDFEKWSNDAKIQFSEQKQNVCSGSNLCLWGRRVNCSGENVTCRFTCEDLTCGTRGNCSVSVDNQPFCRCESDDQYDYSGEGCKTATLKWEIVLAVSGGLGGAAAVILGVALTVMCYRRWRGKSADYFRTHRDPDQGLGHYQSHSTVASSNRLGKPLFRPSFLSPSIEPGTSASYKLFQSERRNSEWGNYQNDLGSMEDIYPDFTPTLEHIDTHADYSIARPQLQITWRKPTLWRPLTNIGSINL